MRVTALAGGIGGSKLLLGLYRVMDPRDLTIIANTGDDIVLHGLFISPDLDTITYTLGGVVNIDPGWGFRDETFNTFRQLGQYGHQTWFSLGDRDLATHIHRSAMLRDGATLTQAAESIRLALGVQAKVLPMTDRPVPTVVETPEGRLHFQEYLVQRHAEPVVKSLAFVGVDRARPAAGVMEAIDEVGAIIICPSNPLISIGPIVAVPGIREALRKRRAHIVAVCPLVGGKALKGPTDRMMADLGFDVSATGIARMYQDFCATLVIDSADAGESSAIEALGMKPVVAPTVMTSVADKENLARVCLKLFSNPQS
jgi:LPPG:FO 2-phospho-L-lactate transferase